MFMWLPCREETMGAGTGVGGSLPPLGPHRDGIHGGQKIENNLS